MTDESTPRTPTEMLEVVQKIHHYLEDVAENPSRVERAQELATEAVTDALARLERDLAAMRSTMLAMRQQRDVYGDEVARLKRENVRLESHKVAYDEISKRLDEAHAYCQKYGGARALGRNVWHVILDDAIRLRALTDTGEDTDDAD